MKLHAAPRIGWELRGKEQTSAARRNDDDWGPAEPKRARKRFYPLATSIHSHIAEAKRGHLTSESRRNTFSQDGQRLQSDRGPKLLILEHAEVVQIAPAIFRVKNKMGRQYRLRGTVTTDIPRQGRRRSPASCCGSQDQHHG